MPKLSESKVTDEIMDEVLDPTPKVKTKRIFFPVDNTNPSNIKFYGWLNGKYYEYLRGEVSEVPVDIAAEVISTGAGKEVK